MIEDDSSWNHFTLIFRAGDQENLAKSKTNLELIISKATSKHLCEFGMARLAINNLAPTPVKCLNQLWFP